MAISPGFCLSAKLDCATGVNQPGDRYMLALYGMDASLSPFTEEYTKEGEVKGQGYSAGGQPLQGYDAHMEGAQAVVVWAKDTLWKNATLRNVRGGLVYNASKGNRAVVVIDVVDIQGNPVTSTNGNFKVEGGIAFVIG